MLPLYLALALLLALVGWYLYRFLRRSLGFWGLPLEKTWAKIALPLLALGLTLLCLDIHSVAMLAVLHTAAFCMLFDLARLLLRRLPHPAFFGKLWRCGLVPVALSLGLLGWGFFHMSDIHRTAYQLPTRSAAAGTRILFLSDLHFGNALDIPDLPELCSLLQAEQADLILLGGDLVDEGTSLAQMQALFAALGSLESRYGCYYVPGNHDAMAYGRGDFGPEQIALAARESGVCLLEDAAVELGPITLLLRRDISRGERAPTASLLQGDEDFLLVMDHQPRDMEENAAAGADLMLSGHTHNGQIWPIVYINRLIGPTYGSYRYGQMELIVSSGLCGWGFPVRTYGVSEYVVIDLV